MKNHLINSRGASSPLLRMAVHGGAVAATLLAPLAGHAQDGQTQSVGLEEIVVTATRREESAQDVPVSIAVFGQEQMDSQGVRQIDDIARLSPSIQFERSSGFGSGLGNSISIRGLSAISGPATTGIYIDDTPTQVGATIASGSFTNNAYPMLFDIARVEVLSGPQGTLFGSSSEGGAIRFIQPAPNMADTSMYARSEVSQTEGGAPSYEAGLAGGAPLIEDKLGFRASVWTRRTGGYIDLVDYYTGEVKNPDNNYQDAVSARFALGWQVNDNVMVTPSFYYQKIEANGGSGGFYFPSDGVGDVIVNQPYGDPENGEYVDLHQLNQWDEQTVKLSAIKVDWTLPNDMQLFSNTSYYERKQTGLTDFAPLEVAFWDGSSLWPEDATWTFPGHDSQGNEFVTQEIRLQSTDSDARLQWLVGVFYSDNETTDTRAVENVHYPIVDILAMFSGGVRTELADGIYAFKNATSLKEKQKAVFGQADFNIVGGLIATLGLRYAEFETDWTNYAGGPISGSDWPGPGGQPKHGTASSDVVIPKYMLSYKTDDTLTYISATKGFRNGGVNAPINNPACGPELAALGLSAAPGSYEPDNLWSYELGSKFQLLDRRLIIDAAIYQYDWSDMIRNQSLPTCTLSFTTNFGTATGRGFEFAAQYLPIPELTLGMNLGYFSLESTQEIRALPTLAFPQGQVQVKDGQLLSDGGRLNANLVYTFNIAELDAYFRADYNYQRRPKSLNDEATGTASWESDSRQVFETPGYGMGNVRLGVNVGNWDLSIFGNNVTDKQVLFKTRSTVGFAGSATSVVMGTTLYPRTFGVTAVYRY